MEGGRFLLAVILMVAVVVVTNIFFPPVAPVPETGADSVAAATQPVAPPPAGAAASGEPAVAAPEQPRQTAGAPADTVVITSPLYRYGVSTRGGAIARADLLTYESMTEPGQPVSLVPAGVDGLVRHRLRIGDRNVDLATLPFRPEGSDRQLAAGDAADTVSMVYADSTGFQVRFDYEFHPDEYVIDVRGRVSGIPGSTTPQLLIDFGPTLPFHEWNEKEEARVLAYVVNNPQTGIESVPLDRVTAERVENGPLVWVAFKNKYFVAAAIEAAVEPQPFGGVIARPEPGEHTADLTATLLPNARGEFAYRLYLGPQQYDRLNAIGHQFGDVNPYGWRLLRPVIRPLAHAISWLLLEMHNVFNIAYGWVLILFGVMIRVLLWPLNAKAMRSQMKQMELQPRLKEIQTKYKDEPEQLQREMMKLWKEEGFNPMGGCLPMLIPFPVLITLFFVFQSTIEFRGVPFLWLPDLSRPDPLYIIPVAMGVSMFFLQWLSQRSMPQANPQMKMMMWIMPIFMTVLFLNFASGLNLYYTAMNMASLPQQWMISKERQRWHASRGTPPAKQPAKT